MSVVLGKHLFAVRQFFNRLKENRRFKICDTRHSAYILTPLGLTGNEKRPFSSAEVLFVCTKYKHLQKYLKDDGIWPDEAALGSELEKEQKRREEHRRSDIRFLQHVIKHGGPCNSYEGHRFFTIVHSYPDEVWLFGTTLNPGYYERYLYKVVEAANKKKKP